MNWSNGFQKSLWTQYQFVNVYEYIQYKTQHQQRFVIRAYHNRRLNGLSEMLFTYLSERPV